MEEKYETFCFIYHIGSRFQSIPGQYVFALQCTDANRDNPARNPADDFQCIPAPAQKQRPMGRLAVKILNDNTSSLTAQ